MDSITNATAVVNNRPNVTADAAYLPNVTAAFFRIIFIPGHCVFSSNGFNFKLHRSLSVLPFVRVLENRDGPNLWYMSYSREASF